MDASGWNGALSIEVEPGASPAPRVCHPPPPRPPRREEAPPQLSCAVGWGIVVDRTGVLYVPHTWEHAWEAMLWLDDMLAPYPEGHYWRQVLAVRSAPLITRRRGGWGRPGSVAGGDLRVAEADA